ncbi:MAG: hypothetical protein QOH17_3538 [Pseudonocardiales bacterium]|nr:hypothetical protein [Pseudonocardiales bacterium]
MVEARPIVMARIAWAASAVVFAAFLFTALVMKHANAGADFDTKDQFGTVVVGLILAALLIMPTRPRLRADAEALRLRSFLGGWRVVPWDVVVRVDFPNNLRFARAVLPGDEALAIYAVQRLDKDRAVRTMEQLRALVAEVKARS